MDQMRKFEITVVSVLAALFMLTIAGVVTLDSKQKFELEMAKIEMGHCEDK